MHSGRVRDCFGVFAFGGAYPFFIFRSRKTSRSALREVILRKNNPWEQFGAFQLNLTRKDFVWDTGQVFYVLPAERRARRSVVKIKTWASVAMFYHVV
jgi:hypothetical protein